MLKNSRRLPKQMLIFVAVALLVISSAGQAGKIYKWVDANGKTHFGDRTTNDGEDVQEIVIPKTPTVDPSVNTRKERTERLLDNYAHKITQIKRKCVRLQPRQNLSAKLIANQQRACN